MKFINKIKKVVVGIAFKRLPIKAVVLTSLSIFVLSTQIVAATNPLGFWSTITDTVGAIKGLFSIEGITDVIFRILNFVIDLALPPLVTLAGWIFDWALSLSVNANTSIVTIGWGKSLALANNLFILILLGIAIGTILGLASFNYKTMLPKFLMVALLINFSMTIGNVIIGATNMLAKGFYNDITAQTADLQALGIKPSPSEKVANRFAVTKASELTYKKFKENAENAPDKNSDPIKRLFDNIAMFVYKIFQYLLAIFVFLSGAVYMISRTFNLWLLLMLAPLAWIALLLPGLQEHYKKWWSNFMKWSIFAPAYLFFLWLGLQIGNAAVLKGFVSEYAGFSGIAADITGFIIQMLLVAFMMTAGLVISSKLGVGGSNFVLNYADKAKGAASKKFKDLRGQSAWSAEKLGEKFGGLGARGLASIPGVGRLAGYRPDEVRGRLEIDRQKHQQEALEREKLRLSGQIAGMDEGARRIHLDGLTAGARSGTGPTSLAQAAAINMLMEDKVAMEDLSEQQQFYMRRAQAAAISSNQQNNIQVDYNPERQVSRAIEKDISSTIDRWKKTDSYTYPAGHPRAGTTVDYRSMDIQSLMHAVDNDILNGNAGADTAIALSVLNDRVDEAIPHIPGANTPRDIARIKAEYRRYEKIGQRSAALGATSAAYI